jgi:PAS domain S-box-containing protein
MPSTLPGAVDASTLARLLNRAAQPFALLDLEGRFVQVNQAFEHLLGYGPGELNGTAVADVTPDTSMKTTIEALQRLVDADQPQKYEKEYVRKDGKRVPVSVVADLYRDEKDALRGYFAFVSDISERVRSERALRASEDRFRRLYDEAPFGYHEIDGQGRILSINRTECEMLGYDREDLIGRNIVDLVAPEAREEASRAIAEKVRGTRPLVPFEREYVTHDGRHMIVLIEERYARDAVGRIVGIRSTVRDVTAARLTEAALVASERRVRALLEGIQDSVFVHDMDGRILEANSAACRRLGYTREEFLRLATRDIDAPETEQGFVDRLDHQVREGGLAFEGRHVTKQGKPVPVDINTSLIHFEGRPAVLAVCRDITERRALEETRRQLAEAQLDYARQLEQTNQELVRSEARARQLTQGCLDAVVATDESGRITDFNPAAERAFGQAAADVLGQPIEVLFPAEVQAQAARRDGPVGGLPAHLSVGRTVELRARRRNGEVFPVELSLGEVDVAGRKQYIASIRDQTERQRMYSVLAQTEKLASIGLLSAGLAHEINNPLAFVSNNLAVLERDLKGVLAILRAYDEARERLEPVAPDAVARVRELADELDWEYVRDNLGRTIMRTREGVQRVTNIVHNLRSLARSSPPQLVRTSLREVLESALDIAQGQARKAGIQLDRELATDLPKVACADSQVGQVFLNLIVNAIQAVEGAWPRGGGKVVVRLRAEGDTQVVEVRDNGPGIPAEHVSRLFDPFFTTKPVGEGTGLGLAFSHGIVTGHGGRIDVASKAGEGALFRVVLPVRPVLREATTAAPAPSGAT